LNCKFVSFALIPGTRVGQIGSTAATKVDVRSCRYLIEYRSHGGRRVLSGELYYRLAVVPIEIPPLRERPRIFSRRCSHFFEVCKAEALTPSLRLPPDLLPALVAIAGPVMSAGGEPDRALIVLCDGNEITLNDLPAPMRAAAVSDDLIRIELPEQGLDLEAVEKELITKALHKLRETRPVRRSLRGLVKRLSNACTQRGTT